MTSDISDIVTAIVLFFLLSVWVVIGCAGLVEMYRGTKSIFIILLYVFPPIYTVLTGWQHIYYSSAAVAVASASYFSYSNSGKHSGKVMFSTESKPGRILGGAAYFTFFSIFIAGLLEVGIEWYQEIYQMLRGV